MWSCRTGNAGLGEKKIVVPDISCSADGFKEVLVGAFPKLEGCGGFELLRCIPNSKELEPFSIAVSQSPKMLKSVLGAGRVYIRPIQKSLQLEEDENEIYSEEVGNPENYSVV